MGVSKKFIYSYVNWYFAELNEVFHEKFVEPTRTLFVYTDLVQTQLVGGTETDLLKKKWSSTRRLKEERNLSRVKYNTFRYEKTDLIL